MTLALNLLVTTEWGIITPIETNAMVAQPGFSRYSDNFERQCDKDKGFY